MVKKESGIEEAYQDKSYRLFFAWLFLFAALMVVYSLFPDKIPIRGVGKAAGIIIFAMLDLLYILIYVTQSVYWVSGVSYEDAAKAGASARKRYAMRYLLVFLGMTAAYLIYCFGLNAVWRASTIRDSMAAAVMICVAALGTMHIKL